MYAMEYCDGEPLDRLLRRERSLSPQRALEILLQVTKGLQYAHAQGVIHRDVKPANIFITKDGSTKILDLGLAKTVGESERSFLTMSGAVVGTPHYISPEQAEGSRTIDGRADIYSLGATFYHLLTGQTPFDGSSPVKVMYKHVHGELPDPRDLRDDIPDSYVHLLRKMMAKKPEDRYATCDDLFADLKEIITGGSPKSAALHLQQSTIAPARKIRAVPKRPSTVRRAPSSGGAVVVWSGLAIAAVGIGILLLSKSGGETEPPSRSGPKPAPAKSTAVSSKTMPAAPPSSESVVPLLSMIDAEHPLKGIWKFENGELLNDAAPGARVFVPYEPPEEYDVRMDFTPLTSPDFALLLSRNGRAFLWLMGAVGNTHFGLGFREGAPNKAGILYKTVRPMCLASNWRYRSIVQVRRNRLTASLDGEVLVDGSPDLSTFAPSPIFPFPAGTTLGILCSQGSVRIHRLEIVEVTGKGRRTRPAAEPGSTPKPVDVEARPWRPIFDGKTLEGFGSGAREDWRVEEGAIVPIAGKIKAIRTSREVSDGQVRIRFEARNLRLLELHVRQGPQGEHSIILNAPEFAQLGVGPHEAVFTCDGDRVEATLNGGPVSVSSERRPRQGAIQIYRQGDGLRILSIDVR